MEHENTGSERESKIQYAIQRVDSKAYPSPYSFQYDHLKRQNEWGYNRFLCELAITLKDSKIIDLGCGADVRYMVDIVCRLGASEYVGVDKYNIKEAIVNSKKPEISQKVQKSNLQFNLVDKDMLEFLSQQPDNSANITINGVDNDILDPRNPGNKIYFPLLINEIIRVAGKDHVIFGIGCKEIFEEIHNKGLSENIFASDRVKIRMYKSEK